jgi:branched-chain amino acid transport system substrate-binding protein
MMKRAAILPVLAAIALTAVVAGAQSPSDPIRVGFMAPLTGIFAQAGQDMLAGLKLAFDEMGNQVAGRKIELIAEDDEGNPARAVAKYRKLVSQDKVHVLTGVLLSNIGYGLIPNIDADRLPSMYLTTPDELTKRKPVKWLMRLNFSASQPMHPLGEYAAKTLKYKRVAAIAMDNPFGHEQIGGFQRVFEDAGGAVVQKLWVPLNAMDFGPYLTQIRKDVDAVCAVFVAGQSVRFVKQYADQGLKRFPLIGSGVMMDEHALRGMDDEAVGTISALIWSPTLDNPANKAFMKFAEGKLGKTPAYFTAVMYSSGRWIAKATEAVKGNVDDREQFMTALRRATEESPDPRGPIKLDDWGNPTQNVYILKVERSGGKLVNTVVHTYPLVSQFWTYKPDDFLKLPAYTRDHPPVKP